MKRTLVTVLVLMVVMIASLEAFSKKEKVLWMKIGEDGEVKASIAISVTLARHLLDEDRDSHEDPIDRDLITREMIDDVLSGRKESVESTDRETGKSARLWIGSLEIESAEEDDEGDLVIEVFKKGKRSFTMRLPYAEESRERDEDDPDITRMTFGWNSLMPFMAESRGVIYVKDHDDDTEFWMYVN